jgi:hypothetical protein
VWALIAGVALLRVGIGLWQLRKLRRSCSVIDTATLDPAPRATLQAFQPIRRVTLCQSDRLRVPTAIGFLKPVVVIPTWALHELSTAELNSILIHELAHLRRWDDWTNLAQQVLKALLFFHPAVWWIENKLALEREMACDDAVLAETANPRGYAKCLISVAEKSFMRRGLALAQAAVNRVRQTSLRVSQILDVNRSSATHVWKPALYSVAAFFVACLLSLSHAPELVAFKDPPPEAMALATTAGTTLASATELNSFAKPAVVTPATFHVKNAEPIAERAVWERPQQPQSGVRIQPTAQVVGGSVTAVEPQRGERTVAARTAQPLVRASSSPGSDSARAAETTPRQNSARLLIARSVSQNEFVQAESAMPIEHSSAPQAIFVVMQYNEGGPVFWTVAVWRVTVVNSTRNQIPANKI